MKQIFFFLFIILNNHIFSQNNSFISLQKEVQVTSTSEGGSLKCEPSVVIDDNVIIVSWNDSYGGQTGSVAGTCIGWAISYDYGHTFKFGGYLSKTEKGSYDGADSWLSKDSDGNFYLQVLSFTKAVHLYFMDSNNLGHWVKLTDPVVSKSADKPFLHIEGNNNIWISYSDNQKIYTVFSRNKGKTWSKPILVSNDKPKIRGGSSIISYNNRIFITWAEGKKGTFFFNELWYNEISNNVSSTPKLIFKQKDSKGMLTPGYSIGFDHAKTSGHVDTPNLTWLNSTNSESHTINVTFGTKSKNISKILFFDYDLKNSYWKEPIEVGNIPYSFSRIFASNSSLNDVPAILYYDRRNCTTENCTITDVYLSILINEKWTDYKINQKSTDWNNIVGDKTYAPVQRNFGDYITLSKDKNRLAAAWTDGRNGTSQIYIRVIELK